MLSKLPEQQITLWTLRQCNYPLNDVVAKPEGCEYSLLSLLRDQVLKILRLCPCGPVSHHDKKWRMRITLLASYCLIQEPGASQTL